jgi:hypothetical protein
MTHRLSTALSAAAIAAAVASCGSSEQAGGEAGAKRAVRAYIAAIDARDGGRVCADLEPGAMRELALPKAGHGCPSSVTASIGYRDPRGYPVWRGTRIVGFRSVDLTGATARATVTVRTTFAGNREPSIEDDVIYLDQSDGRWLVAKPSGTLYRAIGASSPPVSAFRAPRLD